jgi:hypothetical protein
VPNSESSGSAKFYLSLTGLLGVGILAILVGHSLHLDKTIRGDLLASLGDAIIIASLLAMTVDQYMKRSLTREIQTDAYKFIVGYGLPAILQDEIKRVVEGSRILRRDYRISYNLSVCNEHGRLFIRILLRVHFNLHNLTGRTYVYQQKTQAFPEEGSANNEVKEFSFRYLKQEGGTVKEEIIYSCPTRTPFEKVPSSEGEWIMAPRVEVPAMSVNGGEYRSYEVGATYSSDSELIAGDSYEFTEPTTDVIVKIEHPPELRVYLYPRADGQADNEVISNQEYTYHRLFAKKQAIALRWAPGHGTLQKREDYYD